MSLITTLLEVKNLLKDSYYMIGKHPKDNAKWFLMKKDGELMEIKEEDLFVMIDKYFKQNF